MLAPNKINKIRVTNLFYHVEIYLVCVVSSQSLFALSLSILVCVDGSAKHFINGRVGGKNETLFQLHTFKANA